MNLNDLNILTAAALSVPGARTSTVTGTGVDISAYEGVLKVLQLVGAVTGTTPTLDGKIQASADNSAWTDVSGATFTQVTAANSDQAIAVDTRLVGATVTGAKYIRYVGTIAGTTPSFTMAVEFVGGKKRLGSL